MAQKIITRLTTYRGDNPSNRIGQAVPPIYMGMNPLPISVFPPVKQPFPTGGDKVDTVSISGISTGRVAIGAKPAGTKGRGVRHKATNGGAVGRYVGKGKNNNTAGNKKAGKKKARGKVVGRNGNGQFKKKGA